VTSESESETIPWIQAKQAKYAYAYDKGGKVARFFGVSGIPHAVLIDPTGKVAWVGSPFTLTDEIVQSSLSGALLHPLFDWPASAKPVTQSLAKGDYAGAVAKAAKVPAADGGADIAAQVQAIVEGQVKWIEAALEAGNFYDARERGEMLGKSLEGLPEQARAKKVVANVDAHPDAKRVLEAQKAIRKLQSKGLSKRKELEKALEDLKKISTEMRGTYAATEAETFMESIRAKLQK
jgi:hypothetical protein